MSVAFKEFEEVRRAHGALSTRPLGVIQVPVDEIVGSVGRARYFPKGLRPGRGLTPSRVQRLVAALNRGEVFPAVQLYRLGHEYFIVDGHHRVAAARMAGQQYVDAEVVAFLPEGHRPEDVVARERVLFEQRTGITTIVLHEMGQYPKLLRWIEDYRRQRRRSLRSAAREWYTRIYLPTLDELRQRRLMTFFPGRSLGDRRARVVHAHLSTDTRRAAPTASHHVLSRPFARRSVRVPGRPQVDHEQSGGAGYRHGGCDRQLRAVSRVRPGGRWICPLAPQARSDRPPGATADRRAETPPAPRIPLNGS